MICNPRLNDGSVDSPLVAHIAGQLDALCGPGLELPDGQVAEVARAVETFLVHESNEGLVDSSYLVVLASRALTSLGQGEAARRLLVFGTGLVSPAAWELAWGESMWVLDLKHMVVANDAALEIVFFSSLNIVVESIADIWNDSNGSGALGLRHVCAAAASLLGKPPQSSASKALVREILDTCSANLVRVAEGRGWSEAPRVMNLDL